MSNVYEPVEVVSDYFPDLVLTCVGNYGPNGRYPIYSDLIDAMAYTAKTRLKNHHQNVFLIEGGTGSGKSTLAIQICKAIDKDWSLSDNYIYGLTDLKRKLKTKQENCINFFDEGSVILNSFNSQRKEDKQLTVLFDTMRSLNWTTIICIPDYESCNKRIRENHVDYRLICPSKAPLPNRASRGFFNVYKRKRASFQKKVFWLPIGTGIYDALKPQLETEYHQIKRRSQDRILASFINEEDD